MGQPNTIRKFFQPPLGVDLRVGATGRKMEMCRSMLNVDIQETIDGDVLGKRKGSQYIGGGFHANQYAPCLWNGNSVLLQGILGLFDYQRISRTTGLRTTEVVVCEVNPYKLVPTPITFTYSGAGTATVSLFPKTSGNVFTLVLTDTADITHSYDLANIAVNAADYRLETLEATIDALANWEMTIGTGHQGYTSAAVGPVTTISVDNGAGAAHNLVVGETIRIPLAAGGWTYRRITAVNAASTNLSFDGTPITVGDNALIRLGVVDYAASLMEQCVSGNLTVGQSLAANIQALESIYSPIDFPSNAPFNVSQTTSGSETYVPPMALNMLNNLYIAAPYNSNAGLASYFKYDGQNCYRAGMPKPAIASLAAGAAAAPFVDAGVHGYILVFSHKDAQGNIIEGIASEPAFFTAGGATKVGVTITNGDLQFVLTTGKGFLTNYARTNGIQAGVSTIVVDGIDTNSDHSLHVGDVVCLYNTATSAVVERTITQATYDHDGTTSTITISGGVVSVADNSPITCNLKVDIYRTMAGGYNYYFVDSIPLDVEVATTVYVDSTTDAILLNRAEYLYPDVNEEHGLAPLSPRSMAIFQGSMCLGGDISAPNTLFPSVQGNPEYFPLNLWSDVGKEPNDNIVGLGVLEDSLVIFKNYCSHVLSGSLLDPTTLIPQYRIDLWDDSVGTVSHKSIVNAGGMLFWMDSSGPHGATVGGKPTFIGEPVGALFVANRENAVSGGIPAYSLGLCSSIYDRINKKIIMNIPVGGKELTTTNKFSEVSSQSVALVYDLRRSQNMQIPIWRIWNNQGMSAGSIIVGDDIYQAHNYYEVATGKLVYFISKRLDNNYTTYLYSDLSCYWQDYWDQCAPISWNFETGWEDMDDPETAKIFKRLLIYGPQMTPGTHVNSLYCFFNLHQRVNYDDATAWSQWSLISLSNLGTTGTFSIRDRSKRLRFRPTKAKTMSLKFFDTTIGGNKIQILGWEVEANAPYRPRIGRVE